MTPRNVSGPTQAILGGFVATFSLLSAIPGLTAPEQATGGTRVRQHNMATALAHDESTTITPTVSPTFQASGERGNPLWAVPLTSLTATQQRPIFSPSRRPRPVIEVPSIQPPPPVAIEQPRGPLLALVGAIASEGYGIAILIDQTTKAVVRLKTGEGYAGWTLRLVEGREVTLQRDGETISLTLPNPPAK